jgi:hypothetical protein
MSRFDRAPHQPTIYNAPPADGGHGAGDFSGSRLRPAEATGTFLNFNPNLVSQYATFNPDNQYVMGDAYNKAPAALKVPTDKKLTLNLSMPLAKNYDSEGNVLSHLVGVANFAGTDLIGIVDVRNTPLTPAGDKAPFGGNFRVSADTLFIFTDNTFDPQTANESRAGMAELTTENPKIMLGRAAKTGITYTAGSAETPDKSRVSRTHAEFSFQDNIFGIQDFSTHGTWVKGNEIKDAELAERYRKFGESKAGQEIASHLERLPKAIRFLETGNGSETPTQASHTESDSVDIVKALDDLGFTGTYLDHPTHGREATSLKAKEAVRHLRILQYRMVENNPKMLEMDATFGIPANPADTPETSTETDVVTIKHIGVNGELWLDCKANPEKYRDTPFTFDSLSKRLGIDLPPLPPGLQSPSAPRS